MPILWSGARCTGANQARMRMAGNWQRYGIALLSATFIYAGPPVGLGYLAGIGPTPLRFAAEVRRDPSKVLPPLIMTDLSTNKPTELPPNQASAELEIPDIELEYAALQAPPQPATGPVTNAPVMVGPAPGFIPAGPGGMPVLGYFNHPTNHQSFISTPVEFTPPIPSFNRSSAVYISR